MSINIAICDDNKTSQIQIYEILKNHFAEHRIKTSFTAFDDGKQLLESNKMFDIIILDIKMGEIDGITVKDRLYQLGSESKIIFLSGNGSQIQKAFGKNVYGFVDKANVLDIFCFIDQIIEEYKSTRLINLSGTLIDIWKVQYLEADRVYCKLYINKNEYKLVRKSLKEMAELLVKDETFIRTHRSYIVNLRFVEGMSAKQVILKNTAVIPISSLYINEVTEKIKKFK